MTQFGFTKIVVGDLEGLAQFYCNAFGFEQRKRLQGEVGSDEIDEIVVAPPEAEGDFPPGSLILLKFVGLPDPPAGRIIVGFTTSDIDALLERVRAHGGSIHAPPKLLEGMRVGFAKDPEGNLAEIVEMPPNA